MIRAATIADAAGIARVYVETWRDTYAGVIPDRVLLGMSRRRHAANWTHTLRNRRPGEAVLVAHDTRTGVVGFGSCGRAKYRTLPHEGEVYTLYVLPDYQGRGIGARLLSGLFAELMKSGPRSALIWVLADNPSRFFYQALGGTWIAVREESLWGKNLRQMAYGWGDLKRAVARCGSYSRP